MIIYFTNYVFGSLCSFSFFFGSFGIYFFGISPVVFVTRGVQPKLQGDQNCQGPIAIPNWSLSSLSVYVYGGYREMVYGFYGPCSMSGCLGGG